MKIGQIIRYPALPSLEIEIDGLPNWYHQTAAPRDKSWSSVKLDSGINTSAVLAGPDRAVPFLGLRSSPHRFGSTATPWEDIHRPDQGYCRFFGDNKPGVTAASDSLGNRRMLDAFILQSGGIDERLNAPPVLVFEALPYEGRIKGQVIFHGFGVITRAELVVQRSKETGPTFPNFVYDVALLKLEAENEEFPWTWINARRDPLIGAEASLGLAPESWRQWVRDGNDSIPTLRRNVITRNVVSEAMQRPTEGSPDHQILSQIYNHFSGMNHKFEVLAEFATQLIFHEQGMHYVNGWITQGSGDGGFDFVGALDLDPFGPLKSSRQVILGQAKCEKLNRPTNGLHIARLAARLRRGWVGVYVTTSYFSIPVQREVLSDRYPILLVDGARLATLIRNHLQSSGVNLADFLSRITLDYEKKIRFQDPEMVLDYT
jgi:hypothetical protein